MWRVCEGWSAASAPLARVNEPRQVWRLTDKNRVARYNEHMRFFLAALILILLPSAFAYDEASLNGLLSKYVSGEGLVDYTAWKASDTDLSALRTFTDELASFDPTSLSEGERLAFWINAYNAFALREVLERYPVETIRPRDFLGIPERSFFTEEKHVVNGTSYSLDEIENDVLRSQFEEPRIHFAIVCASTSCPELRTEAYTAERLEAQLNEQARSFINDPIRNRYETSTASISKIFDWFEGDFTDAAASVPAYLTSFADEEATAVLESPELDVEYMSYDWGLNDQAR